MKISKLIKGILTGDIDTNSLSKEQVVEVEAIMQLMKAQCDSVVKQDEASLNKKTQEIVDYASNGQWKLKKAIKPGPTLDYGKIDPASHPISNPAAAAEAKSTKYSNIEAKAPTIDYKGGGIVKPTYTGAANRAAEVRAKLDAESKETAAETIARRQKMIKDEGANLDKEPSSSNKAKMIAKDESMGYGVASNTAPMQMSEKEPHMEDPEHEKKEEKKAKKIKQKAQELLDMHKNK